MNGLMRIGTDSGSMIVEIQSQEPGYRPVGRDDLIPEAKVGLEQALDDVCGGAKALLQHLAADDLKPDCIELEFGLRINAEVGAVIAKAASEGHFTVKLTWSREDNPTA